MQNNSKWNEWLGQPTPAKASGFAFSLAAVLPVLLSLFFLITLAVIAPAEGYEKSDWYLYISYLLPQTAFLLTIVCYFSYTKISIKQTLAAQKCPPKYFAIATLFQAGLFGLSQINGWFIQWLEKFGYVDSGIALPSLNGFGLIGVLLVVAVLAATLEEILFRGLILEGLRQNFSTLPTVLLCGALFALYHQNPAQTLYQFCCGAIFALIALRAGSVLPTILSHFLNNAAIIILLKCGVTVFSPLANAIVYAVSAVCFIAGGIWLWKGDKNTQNQARKNQRESRTFFLFAAVGIAVCTLTWLSVLFVGM